MGGSTTSTILVVDDNDGMRMLCRINLEAEGYRVLEAESAAEAARAFEVEEEISLVLLDRRLVGDEDGLDLARRIRAEHPGTPIVGISGTVPIPPSFTGIVDASVTKPFGVDDLLATVEQFVPSPSNRAGRAAGQ